MPRAVALLALAAALCGAQNEECSATTQIDGREFPEWVAVDGERQLLTGGGTRYKYRVAKVYALGLYVAEGAVAGALAPFAGKGAEALQADPAFFAAVQTGVRVVGRPPTTTEPAFDPAPAASEKMTTLA